MPHTGTHDLERFISGFQRFQQHYFDTAPALFRNLCRGQNPRTLLIGCCDSRVDPALLLGCDPGDIFTVRNVANLVPLPDEHGGQQGVLAAIQFAVEQLAVGRIIVLGHSQCGGIRALMEQRLDSAGQADYIGRWVNIAEPARAQVLRQLPQASLAEQRRACEQASILISLSNLESFACVRRQLERGAISLHGWYFDLEAGALLAYSPRADTFLPLV
ncbi:carbonic anhydrase [Bordetella petrii]|nr:carbonic anhydrase [Bordetella petrii]